MFLPDLNNPPDAYKLLCKAIFNNIKRIYITCNTLICTVIHKRFNFIGDFVVLLFVSRQSIVFKIERRHIDIEYPGGTNRSIIEEAEKPSFVNPVPDFVSHIRSVRWP